MYRRSTSMIGVSWTASASGGVRATYSAEQIPRLSAEEEADDHKSPAGRDPCASTHPLYASDILRLQLVVSASSRWGGRALG